MSAAHHAQVAGCAVTEGRLVKGATIEVRRGKAIVFYGKLESLRRVKDIVDEVRGGNFISMLLLVLCNITF